MSERVESICRGCFHSYVCEQFNEHRDGDNKKCHFYNDHYVPAADVVEVKHGRWRHDINNLYGCSECMERETMSPKKLKPYCPNCGAKMDGGADNG